MAYSHLAAIHLATVLPAAVLGAVLLAAAKGTPRHKATGKVYMVLMLTTALVTLFMPAEVGPAWRGHWGVIHLLCIVVFTTIARALYAVRHHNIPAHKRAMTALYFGGIVLAGTFALRPGRMIHLWLLG